MVFPEIAVQMIEDIPFSEAPERGEKGAFIAIPCQAVQDDIRAQMRDAVPDKGEVFLLFQGGVFACAIEVCKVAVGKNMQKLQLHALNGQAVEIIVRRTVSLLSPGSPRMICTTTGILRSVRA